MTNAQIGVYGSLGLFCLIWVVTTEIRLRLAEAALLEVKNKNADYQIRAKVSTMLSGDLHAELSKDLTGPDPTIPTT
jgi:hypothetical protein